LKAVRQAMIDHTITRKVKVTDPETGEVRQEERVLRKGLARRFINKQVGRIKRMFSWAVEEELARGGACGASAGQGAEEGQVGSAGEAEGEAGPRRPR
jgi:hypothetical protein